MDLSRPAIKKRLWDRLMSHSVVTRKGCFHYTGPENNTGYGKISMRLRPGANPTGVSTHVLSFMTFIRKLRAGFEVNHLCHNSRCWNPEHLKEGTHVTNCRAKSERRK
jgi:hypothetical protein